MWVGQPFCIWSGEGMDEPKIRGTLGLMKKCLYFFAVGEL